MRTHYYLIDLEHHPDRVSVLGPYSTAMERDGDITHSAQLPFEVNPEPHKDNPNDECLLILAGLTAGVTDPAGPYPDSTARSEDMRWYLREGEPYVVALNLHRGRVAHVDQQQAEDREEEGGIFARCDETTPQEEEDNFNDFMESLLGPQQRN